ncbi:TetR/AcrR family transcriptional regulator [Flindersiella endophytica]
MGIRSDKASATRQAIVEAARRLLAEADDQVSVGDVATAAGVTRVTVYNQFGSRHGLLDAVFAQLAEQAGMDRLLELTADLPPRQACASALKRTCKFWHAERPVLHRLNGIAVLDTELARIFATRESWRRDQLKRLLQRLATTGGIASTLRRSVLLDGFVALSSFQTYDRLGALAEHPTQAASVLDRMLTGMLSF